MAKPQDLTFTDVFEPVLVSVWNCYGQSIEGPRLAKTREAIAHVRNFYRFKGKLPSRLDFGTPRNRVGYLGAFGQRHAYLAYANLGLVAELRPERIPRPDKGALTITTIGAGAAVEVFRVLLWYNSKTQNVRKLTVNCIEKVEEWQPARGAVINQWCKRVFPKVDIFPNEVIADLTRPDTIKKFSEHHDRLVKTDLLLIYNVLNEIEKRHASSIWRNLQYILRQAEKPMLVLLVEPSADKIRPRIDWMREQLMKCGKVIIDEDKHKIEFKEAPIQIAMEGNERGINDRLFGSNHGPPHVALQTSLERHVFACVIEPWSPVPKEDVDRQLASFQGRRSRRSGRFVSSSPADDQQMRLSFVHELQEDRLRSAMKGDMEKYPPKIEHGPSGSEAGK